MTAYMTKSSSVSLSGVTGVTFSFWFWKRTSNASDYLALQYWNGSTWVEQQRWSGTSGATWTQASYSVSGASFQWRWLFVSNGSSTTEGAYIDDIVLSGVTALAPEQGPVAMILLGERTVPDMTGALPSSSSPKGNPVETEALAALPAESGHLSVSPNPAAGAATLRFALATPGSVSLEIYSADGRRVGRAHEGSLAGGEHSIAWDGRDLGGRDLPSGVYWARLMIDGTLTDAARVVRVDR